jgi:zinc protease
MMRRGSRPHSCRPHRAGAALAMIAAGLCACATPKDVRRLQREPPAEPWRANGVMRAARGGNEIDPAPDVMPPVQRTELKNGLTLLVVEDHSLPIIDASLVVRAGATLDGKDAGLAHLTWDLLDEGAGSLQAVTIDTAFADIGSKVVSRAGRESGSVGARFLKQHLDRALELLGMIVLKPTFSQADFDRIKKLHVDYLTAREGDPDAIAEQVLAASIYGAEHPYGQPLEGLAPSLDKLKVTAVKKFWADNASPKTAALVLAGDVTLDEARVLAEKHLGKWRGAAKATKAPDTPPARSRTQIVVVDIPGAPQTHLRLGRALLSAGESDEAAMVIVNAVVAGLSTSRLGQSLRDERRIAHNVRSSMATRIGPGPFVISTTVEAERTGEAIGELLRQLDLLRQSGITEEELTLARVACANAFLALRSSSTHQVVAAGHIFEKSLPPDHQAQLLSSLKQLSLAAVQQAVQRALALEDFVVVVVGDRAAVETALQGKDLGTTTFLKRDGTPDQVK